MTLLPEPVNTLTTPPFYKATIAVKVVNKADDTPTTAPSDAPSDTPSDAPSGSPSDTPSDAPSDAPTDAPSDAPTDAPTTLGNITELKATKATQLVATFDSAVPADTKTTVTKGGSVIDGTAVIEGNSILFDATANFTAGTYTLTAKLGDAEKSAETEVKDSYVAEIKITSKEALTGKKDKSPDTKDGTAAYVYYDVLNQYGESVRTSETIEWTTSPANYTDDKSTGRLTVIKDDVFTYGSTIYVTGVHVKSGQSVTESVTVGMSQAVNSIKFAGFLSMNNKNKIEETLPADFAKNTYVLLYKTYDQNGNELDVTDSEFAGDNLTFICDNPMLIESSLEKCKDTYTVDGVDYAAVKMEPGQYVDKGGEFNITAISNKTGQKSIGNFVVGERGLLQSLVLSTPVSTVADGDQNVKIPYTAKDTKGNAITNYETIVRSTNALSLNASEDSVLYVREENDGTAGIYWSDSHSAMDFGDSSASNGTNRSISLTTIVVGGESNNMMLSVADTRRPTAIKTVGFGDRNDAITDGNTVKFNLNTTDGTDDDANGIIFLDQYGAELAKAKAKAFFEYTKTGYKFGDCNYGIKVDVGSNPALTFEGVVSGSSVVYNGEFSKDVTATAGVDSDSKKVVTSQTVKYSIVKQSKTKAEWVDTSKVKTVAYTIIPVSKLNNRSIGTFAKQELVTNNSSNANGDNDTVKDDGITNTAKGTLAFVGDKVSWGKEANLMIKVTGTYNGLTVTVPQNAYELAPSSEITFKDGWDKSKIGAVSQGALYWNELYDENTAKLTRVDATKTLSLRVDSNGDSVFDSNDETISRAITFSDEVSRPAEIKFVFNNSEGSAKTATMNPALTKVSAPKVFHHEWQSSIKTDLGYVGVLGVMVLDQYGKPMMDYSESDIYNDAAWYCTEKVEFSVSNIEESHTDLTHVPNNFVVNANGSKDMNIVGAEIGDTFTLTATIAGTKISDNVKVTVNADGAAALYSAGVDTSADDCPCDKNLRKILGYAR